MIVYTEEEFAALPVGTELKSNSYQSSAKDTIVRYEKGWGWKWVGEPWMPFKKGTSGLMEGGYTVVKMGLEEPPPELISPLWEMQ